MIRTMVDVEAFGSGGLSLASIGAVRWDGETEIGTFSCVCHAEGDFVPSYVYWWLKQDEAARCSVSEGALTTIEDALGRFSTWYKGKELWSHDYDRILLRDAYEKKGLKVPWHYREARDLRTVDAFFAKEARTQTPKDKPHIAVDDARLQMERLIGNLKKLGVAL